MRRIKQYLLQVFLILVGIFSAGLGIKGFLMSSHFIDGGVTGISMLLAQTLHWPLYLLIPAINLPFVIMGYYQFGLKFAITSSAAIFGLALCIAFISFPDVTPDKLLTAVFGGFFIGGGIGLAIRGGAVLDGTEIAALLISRVSELLRVGDVILLFNCVIFLAAAFLLGVESALYSMLTYIAASKTVNFLLHGIEEYTAVVIVSNQHATIRKHIVNGLKKSVTLYKGAGGVSGDAVDILYCVVTRLEIGAIKNVVKSLDSGAFVVTHALADASGGYIKKATLSIV